MTGEAWEPDTIHLDLAEPEAPKWPEKFKKEYDPPVPKVTRLPDRPRLPALTASEVTRGLSQRARACVNMRLEGASFMEIADFLEYESPQEAKRDCERALAATHPPEDWETLRQMASARAEKLFQNSFAHAQADYLIDSDGNQVPNAEKRQWHAQAATDLMNYATISGAKAPTKVEVTPGEVQMERLVEQMLARSGHQVVEEADVLELTASPTEDGDFYAET